ncbi:MAG TPA: hypothetical protein ENJ38_05510 [Rhodospirillales bacterium]|nr:hypothetical protein [Rhodospirillales bacterium]
MKPKPMFPYRRPKKRPKGGARRQRDGNGRRVPQSAAELLPLLQPATKSLAQMLAGNVKASGQAVHARNVLAQAERLVAERAVDRLPPAAREEFFEQLARLKLTVADAEAMLQEQEAAAEPAPAIEEPTEISAERLRELALSLAVTTSNAAAEQAREPAPPPADEREEEPPALADSAPATPSATPRLGLKSRERLRLKSVVAKPEEGGEAG